MVIITNITLEYLLIIPANIYQLSARITPAVTNRVFQINDPTVVYNKNIGIGIFLMPAGIDIRLLIIGTHLPYKTAFLE